MEGTPFDGLRERQFDVIICGGGLAGLTLARQVRRELPGWAVAVVEKTARPLPVACHKVGESSVELGSQYLERLGLTDYLLDRHLIKFGLRFFPGGGHLPLAQRTEMGPSNEPIIRSYQIDRGRFEEDLRQMVVGEDGVTLLEGVTVRDVELGPGEDAHQITVEANGERQTLTARWAVDATGRAGLLRSRLKLKRGSKHPAHAGWFRIEGRLDIAELVPASEEAWHAIPHADQRWLSTNHLMGDGYWAWIIPLSSGKTSIGLVVHEERHGFDTVRTFEGCMDFLREHEPVLAARLDDAERLDFKCLKGYSNGIARSWSHDRWAVVGEAGAFVDPLYSPGTDFIAFANSFTAEMMRVDREGGDLLTRSRELNLQYRALCSGATDIFRHAAPVYDHARAMALKIYWDNFSYWCFPCQYFLQELYRLTGDRHAVFSGAGQRFVELSDYVQALLRQWALMAPEEPEGGFVGLPQFPSLLVDAHLAMAESMTPDETLAYMTRMVGVGETIVQELVFRILVELGPERGRELLDQADVWRWNLRFDPARLDAEALTGRARHKAVPAVARDLDRTLGPPRRHPEADAAARLLFSGDPTPAAANA